MEQPQQSLSTKGVSLFAVLVVIALLSEQNKFLGFSE